LANLVAPDGTSFELAEEENLIGRGEREYSDPPKVNVGALPGGVTVSRHHARIFRQAGRWFLRVEPEARNPTFVEGRRVLGGEEVPLADNSSIRLGDLEVMFRAPAEASTPSETLVEVAAHEERAAAAVAPAVIAPPPSPPPPAAPPLPPEAPVPAATARPAEWPSRLPPRPSTLTALGVTEFKRVNPFRGLMIDDTVWADAHDYHRLLARLHLLSGHGWGIVEGLEVVADGQTPGLLTVRAGVAIDVQGRALVVGQDRRLEVTTAPGTTLYVAIRFREELAAPQRFWSDTDEYTRVVEKCEVQLLTQPVVAPAVELARVSVDGPVRNAPNPLDPRPGEIDLRFRERLLVRPRPDLVVGQLVLPEGDAPGSVAARHRIGLRYLLREIGRATPYRPRWAGAVRLGEPIPAASLLYVAASSGFQIDNLGLSHLREFLDGGGVILADACASGGDFRAAIGTLAVALERDLRPVDRQHPLLTASHVFAAPALPEAGGASLEEGGGLIRTTADYGCAWQGGSDDHALSREDIRSALEFGVNFGVYARQRQHPLEAVELEA
jgi:hypothetical protein